VISGPGRVAPPLADGREPTTGPWFRPVRSTSVDSGGGARRHPLPDLYIGVHAAVAGYALLTRDPRRYRTYFPKLKLFAP
jgi:hypothetical protein